MKSPTELVKGNKAEFQRYRGGKLVYAVIEKTPIGSFNAVEYVPGFEFEVPIDELGNSTLCSIRLRWSDFFFTRLS